MLRGTLRVGDARQADVDLVAAGALQLRLRDAERVDALAHDVERAVQAVGRDLGLLLGGLALEDELDAALQVETELGLLGEDHRERRGEEAHDREQDEDVATAIGHVRENSLLRRGEHEQEPAVFIVRREQVRDGLRGQIALGVDDDVLAQLADAPLERDAHVVLAAVEVQARARR